MPPAGLGDLAQCTAQIPAFGMLGRCADPAVMQYRLSCAYGHDRLASACARHAIPVGQDLVGCAVCITRHGRDTPVIVEAIL